MPNTRPRPRKVIAETAPGRAGRGDTLGDVRLVINPANDPSFHERATQLARDIAEPEELERSLRDEYERARVVRGVTDVVERWYVYRDGHWVDS